MNRPRFGYERIHIVLRREGWKVNRKRVHRLYRLEGLQVRMLSANASVSVQCATRASTSNLRG
jgi:transposase InsO family protein